MNNKKDVIVMIDYQNLYHRMKHQLGIPAGQVNVLSMLREICIANKLAGREEDVGLKVYTGIPDKEESLEGYTTIVRMRDWLQYNGAEVWTRPLMYCTSKGIKTVKEKGTDVRLASDLVASVAKQEATRFLLVTQDQDLAEAVEVASNLANNLGKPVEMYSLLLGSQVGLRGTTHIPVSAMEVTKFRKIKEARPAVIAELEEAY